MAPILTLTLRFLNDGLSPVEVVVVVVEEALCSVALEEIMLTNPFHGPLTKVVCGSDETDSLVSRLVV